MKWKRFIEEKINGILKESEAEGKNHEICRKQEKPGDVVEIQE